MRLAGYNESTRNFNVSIGWVGKNNNGIIEWQHVDPNSETGKKLIVELDKTFKE